MVTIVKFLIVFTTSIIVHSPDDLYQSVETNNELIDFYDSSNSIRNPRDKVFQILDNQCNVCHRKRNKRLVFTADNMDAWANAIYKQVFIKKRMPRGKKIKLTADEYQELLTWISTTKNKQNGNEL
jgi:uncharacterized membrane protein